MYAEEGDSAPGMVGKGAKLWLQSEPIAAMSMSRVPCLLEGKAKHSDFLARDGVEHGFYHALHKPLLLVVVDLYNLHSEARACQLEDARGGSWIMCCPETPIELMNSNSLYQSTVLMEVSDLQHCNLAT